MKTFMMPQGSPEWLAARRGVVTASEMDAIITPKFEARSGEGVRTYMYRKITEKILGYSEDAGSSFAMGQGSILENECIPWLEFSRDIKVDRVGFCTTDDGRVGCSPDGLIGDDSGLEAKCPQPINALKYLMEGVVPAEYLVQVHASMYVTGRKFWWFVSYSRQWPALIVKVERDEGIQASIRLALGRFLKTYDEKLAQITEMKAAENALQDAAHAIR